MTHWVDFAYPLSGARLAQDHSAALYEALRALAPWLDEEPLAGVHPLRGVTLSAGELLLGGRARLTLRVPDARAGACERLQGGTLDLAEPLTLGHASRRELLAHPVLHARLVVTGAEDEGRFVADVEREVSTLDIDCEVIVGRRGAVRAGGALQPGFSLMLHGLSPGDSLLAQCRGIGLLRKLGCGVFVPHKSVAAVGA